MPKFKRAELVVEARRRNQEQLSTLGRGIADARHRRKKTQQQLAESVGVSRSALGRIERGQGGGHTMDAWQRVALGAGVPLVVRLQRDPLEETLDEGHLAMQELVLRCGRLSGYGRSFELATRPSEPWRSTDVGLRDDRRHILMLCECWNSFGDIGAAARSSTRKVDEAREYAAAIWGTEPHRVASCWIVRDTRRNRALVRRYPEVFATRLPGSSARWVAALTARHRASTQPEPPPEPGLVWSDMNATRLFAWRRR
jgi:transcriptional regulator with XRE-family HTH domain